MFILEAKYSLMAMHTMNRMLHIKLDDHTVESSFFLFMVSRQMSAVSCDRILHTAEGNLWHQLLIHDAGANGSRQGLLQPACDLGYLEDTEWLNNVSVPQGTMSSYKVSDGHPRQSKGGGASHVQRSATLTYQVS